MENENEVLTGLENAHNRKEAEYDLVTNLLNAAEYRTSEDAVTEVEIKRGGKLLFPVRIRPLSDDETRTARKKATTYMPNPNGKKLPKIEKEFNTTLFQSWLIYLATVPEDQKSIWGNKAVMDKYGLMLPVESIGVLLTVGEKDKLLDLVMDVSGLNDDGEEDADEMGLEEYAKN